jgi:Cof subfamily protein (haloacid dehalogenase superfamily)
MLALDLDGTLLRSDLSISYRARNAVKRVDAEGITVVLVSGRVPASMAQFSRILGLHRRPGYLICNNGTLIQESNTGAIVYQTQLNPEAGLFAYDLAAAEGFAVQICEDEVIYVSRRNEFAKYDEKLTGQKQVVAENFREMVAKGCQKLLIPGDPMLLKPLESILRTYLGDEAALFASKPYFLEILPGGTNRGTALAKVAEKLGIGPEAVLAVGNSVNDEAMLRWAGTGVAMLNGDERLKELAALVTGRSNDDDGVADLIDRYILGPEPVPVSGGSPAGDPPGR